MKKAVLTIAIFISAIAAAQNKGVAQIGVRPLQLKVMHVKPSEPTLYVVNFWATWCAPCIKEMPYFEAATKKYGKDIKVLLVSLDFSSDSVRVKKFVESKKLQSDVYHLIGAGNPNDWIDKFDSSWDGALPATIMYKGGEKVYFRQGDFEATELDSLIQSKIK